VLFVHFLLAVNLAKAPRFLVIQGFFRSSFSLNVHPGGTFPFPFSAFFNMLVPCLTFFFLWRARSLFFYLPFLFFGQFSVPCFFLFRWYQPLFHHSGRFFSSLRCMSLCVAGFVPDAPTDPTPNSPPIVLGVPGFTFLSTFFLPSFFVLAAAFSPWAPPTTVWKGLSFFFFCSYTPYKLRPS